MANHDDLDGLALLAKEGTVVIWPSRRRLTVDELRELGQPLHAAGPAVLRELADGRGSVPFGHK